MVKWRSNRHLVKRSPEAVTVLSMLLMLTAVLSIVLGLGIFSLPIGSDEDSSPIVDHIKLKRPTLDISSEEEGLGEGLGERGEQWTEILSWEPRAFLFHNFLLQAQGYSAMIFAERIGLSHGENETVTCSCGNRTLKITL